MNISTILEIAFPDKLTVKSCRYKCCPVKNEFQVVYPNRRKFFRLIPIISERGTAGKRKFKEAKIMKESLIFQGKWTKNYFCKFFKNSVSDGDSSETCSANLGYSSKKRLSFVHKMKYSGVFFSFLYRKKTPSLSLPCQYLVCSSRSLGTFCRRERSALSASSFFVFNFCRELLITPFYLSRSGSQAFWQNFRRFAAFQPKIP